MTIKFQFKNKNEEKEEKKKQNFTNRLGETIASHKMELGRKYAHTQCESWTALIQNNLRRV